MTQKSGPTSLFMKNPPCSLIRSRDANGFHCCLCPGTQAQSPVNCGGRAQPAARAAYRLDHDQAKDAPVILQPGRGAFGNALSDERLRLWWLLAALFLCVSTLTRVFLAGIAISQGQATLSNVPAMMAVGLL